MTRLLFTSERMSFCGVFSRMTWRFSNRVTVAWIDLGDDNTILWKLKQFKGWNSGLNFMSYSYLNVGRINFSYSFVVASWTIAKAGCKQAASTSAALISCCKQGQTCCHQSFYGEWEARKKKLSQKKIKKSFCFEAPHFNLKFTLRWKVIKVRRSSFIFHVFYNLLAQYSGRIYSNRRFESHFVIYEIFFVEKSKIDDELLSRLGFRNSLRFLQTRFSPLLNAIYFPGKPKNSAWSNRNLKIKFSENYFFQLDLDIDFLKLKTVNMFILSVTELRPAQVLRL